jgi:6-pyruvoyltetrahydropterin/6-carboxytetrahydropterin synthase
MHKLARQVPITINPVLSQPDKNQSLSALGAPDEGLSIFLQLGVELAGPVNPDTGFIVNVTTIDDKVHEHIVPLLNKHIGQDFKQGKRIDISELSRLLYLTWDTLSDKFDNAALSTLTLVLNPFQKIFINSEDKDMIYLSEKFEFSATHRLWNDNFSEQQNFDIFGKCANPSGHGHNYTAEVVVKMPTDRRSLHLGSLEQIVNEHFIKLVDHRNLNVDVPHFAKTIPTVENIAAFAWGLLADKFGEAKLHCVTVWETDKTYCSYYG